MATMVESHISSVFHNKEEETPPTRAEVGTAIQRRKNNKSAGTDGIPEELFKAAGSGFNIEFHQPRNHRD